MSSEPEADTRIARRVAFLGICASTALAVLNIVVGMLARSTSVVATGVEFAGDVLASAVVFLGMIVASRSADKDHLYGHGRVETIAAFTVRMILVVGGVGICWNSLQNVGEQHLPPSVAAIAVVMTIIVRGIMSVAKFRIGRRVRSARLVAGAWS